MHRYVPKDPYDDETLLSLGGYGFLSHNCGGWVKYITEKAGLTWPIANRLKYNAGVSVGGPFHGIGKLWDAEWRVARNVFKTVAETPGKVNDKINDFFGQIEYDLRNQPSTGMEDW